MRLSSSWCLVFILFVLPALAQKKNDNLKMRQKALAKQPKPMFLLKRATEDLGVEEPKRDLQRQQQMMVTTDERLRWSTQSTR